MLYDVVILFVVMCLEWVIDVVMLCICIMELLWEVNVWIGFFDVFIDLWFGK